MVILHRSVGGTDENNLKATITLTLLLKLPNFAGAFAVRENITQDQHIQMGEWL